MATPNPTWVLDPEGDVTLVLQKLVPTPETLARRLARRAERKAAPGYYSDYSDEDYEPQCELPKDDFFHEWQGEWPDEEESYSTIPESRRKQTTDDDKDKEEFEVEEVTMRVSSKHMALASPVFYAMINSGFSETQQLREKGHLVLPLPEDDAHAMYDLMRIIHARTKDLSRKIGVKELLAFTVLVDKYQLQDATQFHTDLWLEVIDEKVGHLCGLCKEEKLSLLTIYWVLNKGPEFRQNTCDLIAHGDEKLFDDFNLDQKLPLPDLVIDCVKKARVYKIRTVLKWFNGSIRRYSGHKVCAAEYCDEMVLGDLMKRAVKAHGTWPLDFVLNKGGRIPGKLWYGPLDFVLDKAGSFPGKTLVKVLSHLPITGLRTGCEVRGDASACATSKLSRHVDLFQSQDDCGLRMEHFRGPSCGCEYCYLTCGTEQQVFFDM